MSLPPPKNKPEFFGASLLGACMAVVVSVPAAAYLSAALGDTYEVRATVYCVLLLWAVIGAASIFIVTRSAEQKPFTIGRAFLWFVRAWLWPLLIGVWLLHRNRR